MFEGKYKNFIFINQLNRQMIVLSIILFSVVNSHLSDIILNKGKDIVCSIDNDFTQHLNIVSIVVSILCNNKYIITPYNPNVILILFLFKVIYPKY